MAVFAGTWKDEEGKPFDPSAQAAERSCGGKVASVVRNARGRGANREQLAWAIRTMAQAGWWTLTEQQREDWRFANPIAFYRRDVHLPLVVNPWLHFVMNNACECYHEGGIPNLTQTGWGNAIVAEWLVSCSAATQQFALKFSLLNPYQENNNIRLVVFQVDPRRVPPNLDTPWPPHRRWRGFYDTRLAGFFDQWVADETMFIMTGTCPFIVKAGETLTLLVRLRAAGGHGFTSEETIVVAA